MCFAAALAMMPTQVKEVWGLSVQRPLRVDVLHQDRDSTLDERQGKGFSDYVLSTRIAEPAMV